MHAISKVLAPTVALLTMVQYCPAPFISAIAGVVAGVTASDTAAVVGAAAGVAGAVEGGISASHKKRDIPRPFNSRIKKRQDLSNLGLGTAYPDCLDELKGTTLTFSRPSDNTVLVSGMPPACMALCGVLTGIYNEGNPVPESSSSVSFTNLSSEDIQQIQNALDVHPNYNP
ncbi:hypothetical protein UA08_00956 [Talaromyces atroroseus]|uniref:Uncharacterized protein n=1 Tax=Talaromyces atroroseus TaxID=1441469 RepID=A0A225AYU4_TALAT|nr:hypothetical protein UA08_00956 [Talaromyces atroroseus]OKL63624.1 hypothetical protein UA08_00956 [Talaromyces atroroseus]